MSEQNKKKKTRVVFAYGSQTGTAEDICQQLYMEFCEKHNLFSPDSDRDVALVELNEFNPRPSKKDDDEAKEAKPKLDETRCLVVVSSSTGEGDPPDNALRFNRLLRPAAKNGKTFLESTHFALLGLGDSNYSSFQGCPKQLRKRLLAHGAKEFHDIGSADEVGDFDEDIEKWSVALWPKLDALLENLDAPSPPGNETSAVSEDDTTEKKTAIKKRSKKPKKTSSKASIIPPVVRVSYGGVTMDDVESHDGDAPHVPPAYASQPHHFVPVLNCASLVASEAAKKKYHIELDISRHDEMTFEAGDAFGVHPHNPEQLVNQVCVFLHEASPPDTPLRLDVHDQAADISHSFPTHLPRHATTMRRLLTHAVDLHAVPRRKVLATLASLCDNTSERERLELLASVKQGKEAYQKEILERRPTFAELLVEFPSCHVTLERLLDILPPLAPRYYSVANSPCSKESARRLTAAFTLVDMKLPGDRRHNGVCTNFLAQDPTPASLWTFVKPSPHFRLPDDAKKPIVMVGPGTGVAPFVGFLEHRAWLREQGNELGDAWLFYGCRHPDRDFIYRERLEAFVDQGVLTRLVVAYSAVEPPDPIGRYVQHQMRHHASSVKNILFERPGRLYVCGDAKGMATGVREAINSIVPDGVKKLVAEKRLSEDVWM